MTGLSLATALVGSANHAAQFSVTYLAAAGLAMLAGLTVTRATRRASRPEGHPQGIVPRDPDFLVAQAEFDERLAEA